jgi:mRNA interferase MazF
MTISLVTVADASTLTSCRPAINKVFAYKMESCRRVSPTSYRYRVTVAPMTSTVRGPSTEVPMGPQNGLQQTSVVNCDDVATIPTSALGRHVGYLLPAQEQALSQAFRSAFDPD